jgi:hypothetical protein
MVSASFTYNIPTDQHTAIWNWGDGTISTGTVSEANGSGSVTGSHVYASPGIYLVTLTVTDQRGASGSATAIPGVIVIDPLAGSITGTGTINGPPFDLAFASTTAGTVTFRLDAKYVGNRPAPQGDAVFAFKAAHRTFQSTSLSWLVISGATAWCEGSGTIDRAGSYGFLVSASNRGSKAGRIRIRLWDAATGAVVYDSQPGSPINAAPTTPVSAGHITLRAPRRHKHRAAVQTFGPRWLT